MNIKLNFGKTRIPTTVSNQFVDVDIKLQEETFRHGKGYMMSMHVVTVEPGASPNVTWTSYTPSQGVACWLSEVARASKKQAEYAVNRANELFDWMLGKLKEKNEGLRLAEEVK